ncbi:unnamed protein product [Spirodela intermedia]|uniref:Uncharacterized protein n=1 Tax=Spirodela intermedia TaxID=51605 RepID=A0A7I8JJ47_SPIIN|nr:unnamed protein product [Spirodela intermedia]CAA6670159.1 unnamed protein product [Spirodela intermedia]
MRICHVLILRHLLTRTRTAAARYEVWLLSPAVIIPLRSPCYLVGSGVFNAHYSVASDFSDHSDTEEGRSGSQLGGVRLRARFFVKYDSCDPPSVFPGPPPWGPPISSHMRLSWEDTVGAHKKPSGTVC